MLPTVRHILDLRFSRYVLASVGALVVDMGAFLALLALMTVPWIASAIGYSLGILAHWLLSSRTVFGAGVAGHGPARTRQKALFVVSALIGLGLTTALVASAAAAGMDPRLAKLAAIAVSFLVTWLLRNHIVFRARQIGA